MLRKSQASDFENSENLNSPLLQKKRCCKFTYFILPITHSLCIGLGIYIGIIIKDWSNLDDGSL